MTNPDSQMPTWRIAVIGSGPSAFYAAQFALNQKDVDVRLDMFERLPVPFGLVRLGVAPDHQAVKRVVNIYNKVAASPGFRYFGNVELGRDLQIEDLELRYDQIIYAFGCSKSSNIGLPGEKLAGVHGAAEMVGWYNGHPDFRDECYDLHQVEQAVVIGNGNVALDVAQAEQPPGKGHVVDGMVGKWARRAARAEHGRAARLDAVGKAAVGPLAARKLQRHSRPHSRLVGVAKRRPLSGSQHIRKVSRPLCATCGGRSCLGFAAGGMPIEQ